MNITIIGHGQVGGALAKRLYDLNHNIHIGVPSLPSSSADTLIAKYPKMQVQPLVEAVQWADLIILATPYAANHDIAKTIAPFVADKVVMDCTNPVGAGLSHGLKSEKSGSEVLQSLLPKASIVKAFSIYGFENFIHNDFPKAKSAGIKPVMMYCGDHPHAKKMVGALIADLQWQPLDVGGLVQSLHLEHMTLLWVRMVRMDGHHPHFVWAYLENA